jgi:hypothetical protein
MTHDFASHENSSQFGSENGLLEVELFKERNPAGLSKGRMKLNKLLAAYRAAGQSADMLGGDKEDVFGCRVGEALAKCERR